MDPVTTPPAFDSRKTRRIRSMAAAVLLAFAAGCAVAFYFAWHAGWRPGEDSQAAATSPVATAPGDAELHAAASTDDRLVSSPLTMDLRVDELERRLNRIDLQAEAASGNAARAEGLLIAFASRRLIERGAPLGYLENQLRLRFGNAQPNAVRTIITAAQSPVTLDNLRQRLDKMSAQAVEQPADVSGWEWVKAQLSDLFVVRNASAPSPQPVMRLERAQQLLSDGRVEAAAALVARLPNRDETASWLRDARRYTSTQEALDLIEMAALLEPRSLVDSSGQPVRQRSPAAPAPRPTASPSPTAGN